MGGGRAGCSRRSSRATPCVSFHPSCHSHLLLSSPLADACAPTQPPADPLAPARAAERALALSLAALAPPSHPLVFTRLTPSPTSSDLFGSVSVPDVLAALRERGVEGLSSSASAGGGASSGGGAGEGAQGAFREREGVANGRVKQVGEFVFAVELRATGESVPVRVEVRREDK